MRKIAGGNSSSLPCDTFEQGSGITGFFSQKSHKITNISVQWMEGPYNTWFFFYFFASIWKDPAGSWNKSALCWNSAMPLKGQRSQISSIFDKNRLNLGSLKQPYLQLKTSELQPGRRFERSKASVNYIENSRSNPEQSKNTVLFNLMPKASRYMHPKLMN